VGQLPDVRNCKRCGKIYNYIGGAPVCQDCREDDERIFKRVKEYLYDHAGASLSEVSTTLDVSVEKIKRYLKEGRLEIVGDGANMVLECEKCGKSIRTGRFCNSCSSELSKDLQTTARDINTDISSQESSKRTVEMRYLNKENKNFNLPK
jgi:flagellar operon protein (TIGR03826 family)